MTKDIKVGKVFRGKFATDVLMAVTKVEQSGIIATVKQGNNNPVESMKYYHETFNYYYELTDMVYTRVTFNEYENEIVAFLWDCSANKNTVLQGE